MNKRGIAPDSLESENKHSSAKVEAIDSGKDKLIKEQRDTIAAAQVAIAQAKTELRTLGYKAVRRAYVKMTPAACDVTHIQQMHTYCDENTHLGQLAEGCYVVHDKMRQLSHKSGELYLSVTQIAKATGYSCSQVKRIIRRLNETGWIKQLKRGYGSRTGHQNHANTWYALDHDAWIAKNPGLCATITQTEAKKVATLLKRRKLIDPQVAHDPSIGRPRPDIGSPTTQAQVANDPTSGHARATNPDPNPEGKQEEKLEGKLDENSGTNTPSHFSFEESVPSVPPTDTGKDDISNQHSGNPNSDPVPVAKAEPILELVAMCNIEYKELMDIKPHPQLENAIHKLSVFLTGTGGDFTGKDRQYVSYLLHKGCQVEDIVEALKTYMADKDEYQLRQNIARKFCEGGAVSIISKVRKQRINGPKVAALNNALREAHNAEYRLREEKYDWELDQAEEEYGDDSEEYKSVRIKHRDQPPVPSFYREELPLENDLIWKFIGVVYPNWQELTDKFNQKAIRFKEELAQFKTAHPRTNNKPSGDLLERFR